MTTEELQEIAQVQRAVPYEILRGLTDDDRREIEKIREAECRRLAGICGHWEKQAGIDYLAQWRKETHGIGADEHIRRTYLAVPEAELRQKLIAADAEHQAFVASWYEAKARDAQARLQELEAVRVVGVETVFLLAGTCMLAWLAYSYVGTLAAIIAATGATFGSFGYLLSRSWTQHARVVAARDAYQALYKQSEMINAARARFVPEEIV